MTGQQSVRPTAPAQFDVDGPSWAERSRFGELRAVISPGTDDRLNLFLHSIELYAAKRALRLPTEGRTLLDFGCGNGRFLRFFGARGYSVIGTDITPEMLDSARELGLPPGAQIHLTDGIRLPLPANSVDLIWVCGVLKFGLFRRGVSHGESEPVRSTKDFVPVYADIVQEMDRVLKPGGHVVNVELYVDARPVVFTRDFEQAGFVTRQVSILHRYHTSFDKLCWHHRFPTRLLMPAGQLCAGYSCRFMNPQRNTSGLRDYLFVWSKPLAPGTK